MKKMKVFIVDESPFFRRWFRKLVLALPGTRVLGAASDPLTALKFIRIMRPDAILLDAKTQWHFGIDFIKSLRTASPISKVILLTGQACCLCQKKVVAKADFLLDKVTEYNKIPDVLRQCASTYLSELD